MDLRVDVLLLCAPIPLRSLGVLQLLHDASSGSRHRIREHISAPKLRGSHHSLPQTIISIFSLHDGWYLCHATVV
jgi:hypothetical protein